MLLLLSRLVSLTPAQDTLFPGYYDYYPVRDKQTGSKVTAGNLMRDWPSMVREMVTADGVGVVNNECAGCTPG